MNKYEQRSKNSYNKKAQNYDSTFDGKFTVKFKRMLYDNINVNANDVVADIACGNGRFLNMLAKRAPICGYGFDISEKMIEQAKALNPAMNFFTGGCDNLLLEAESIDIMTVCAAYHHFPEVDKFAKEAGRVIRKEGLLYIAEVYLPGFLRVLANPFVRFSKAGDVKFYSPEEIVSLFEGCGFIRKDVIISGMVQLVILQKV